LILSIRAELGNHICWRLTSALSLTNNLDLGDNFNGKKMTLTKVSSSQSYFDFWSKYDDIVLCSIDIDVNRSVKMKAALAAAALGESGSSKGAPVIYVDADNAKDYKDFTYNKTFWIFDNHTIDNGSFRNFEYNQ
jgi:hypothetical protein